MPLKILYIGGTGEISYECLHATAAAGHSATVFNRGVETDPLPPGVSRITGDLNNQADYAKLGQHHFDVVCQFKAYTPAEARRDIETFSGRCGQYIFISTASAYQKPPAPGRVAESTPLTNPYWDYSQLKAEMEMILTEASQSSGGNKGRLPLTIVRPSHTYSRKFPGPFIWGDDMGWRMLNGRPAVIHGDGQGLWTYTHARDFAKLFLPLFGSPRALGEVFNIMTDTAYTWDHLWHTVAATLGVEPKFIYVPTQTLLRYNPDWTGPMLGDKAWSSLFDTSKIQSLSGPVKNPVPLSEGFAGVKKYFDIRMKNFKPDSKQHELVDRIAREQEALGR